MHPEANRRCCGARTRTTVTVGENLPRGKKEHEEFRRHTQELAECMIEAWRPHFATLGLDLEPVQVIAHTGQISTPCRQLSYW